MFFFYIYIYHTSLHKGMYMMRVLNMPKVVIKIFSFYIISIEYLYNFLLLRYIITYYILIYLYLYCIQAGILFYNNHI